MYNEDNPWWESARCRGAAPKNGDLEEDIFFPPRDKEQYKATAAKAKGKDSVEQAFDDLFNS